MHKIAFSADIENMYLHVELNENGWDFQRIIRRKNQTEPLRDYHLTTVTFGINCSPFLAVAAMQHHAKKERRKFPAASKIVLEDTYMDDVSSGCDDLETAIELQRDVTQLLAEAGFPLRKWISNSKELMEVIPHNEKEGVSMETRGDYQKFFTALRIPWFIESDKIGFKGSPGKIAEKVTKRTVLSELLSIFDPLGLLAPVTIYNKILMQKIWEQQTGWDEEVNPEIKEIWIEFKSQLSMIEKLQVPRWLSYSPSVRTEIIGFSSHHQDIPRKIFS